ncbi:MAG: sporulation initiation factor Spo0A C-terminal domain-containing protein [Clostridia bacterium]|nr:sporulation initiation factor Spo0A C-terminal domain-containing protein [Clostridia bacterium]
MNYELLQKKPPTLEERIFEILKELNVQVGSKGHTYLLDAIQIAVREPDSLNCLTKKIFSRIADTYNTTVSCVESAIRSAITKAWGGGDPNIQQRHFGHTVRFGSGRPSDAEFIAMIANMPEVRKLR